MPAHYLLPRLTHLTLTVEKADNWEDQLDFIGTNYQWNRVKEMERKLEAQ